jgi:hypothetical protein
MTAFNASGSDVDDAVILTARDFYVPIEGTLSVFAGERSASHVLTDTVDILVRYYRRWMSYREV